MQTFLSKAPLNCFLAILTGLYQAIYDSYINIMLQTSVFLMQKYPTLTSLLIRLLDQIISVIYVIFWITPQAGSAI